MKVLYIKNGDSSFLRIDEEILVKNFKTLILTLRVRGRYTYFLQLLKLILILAIILPFQSIAFTRFADWHTAITAFFCRLYRKKLVIVVGGYDVSWFPEYRYGVYDRKIRGKWAKYALRNASLLLPNNPRLIENSNHYMQGITRNGGIEHFIPDRKGRVEVVYNGYHTDFWIPGRTQRQIKLVIMVAFISTKRSYHMKGVDDFITAASRMPDLSFKLIGAEAVQIQKWCKKLPGNLMLSSSLDCEALLKEYQGAKVFCLLSLSEGMPNVLCEAMLCGCIPVVSDVNFNAELVGDAGFVVEKQDDTLIENAIRSAVDSAEDKGMKAREKILENYPYSRREDELVKVIRDLS